MANAQSRKSIFGIILALATPFAILLFPLFGSLDSTDSTGIVNHFKTVTQTNLSPNEPFLVYAGYVGCTTECIATIGHLKTLQDTRSDSSLKDLNIFFINLFDQIEESEAQQYINQTLHGVKVVNATHEIEGWLNTIHANGSEPRAENGQIIIDHPDQFYLFTPMNSGWEMERFAPAYLIGKF